METDNTFKISDQETADFNGNNAEVKGPIKSLDKDVLSTIKDHIITSDGRVFYPCQFCNKVFPIKKSRTVHIKKCSAKEYILSIGENSTKAGNTKIEEYEVTCSIPETKKVSNKIDIQQNIVLNQQMDVSEILSKSKSPPIKLTIRRKPNNGNNGVSHHFTVTNSLVLKEKNESDDFNTIAKRLESNSVSIIKQSKNSEIENEPVQSEIMNEPVKSDVVNESVKSNGNAEENADDNADHPEDSDESSETSCRECPTELKSPIELLRHSRKCHSYPKVLMALSEVKKFYSAKDRSECPICHKPLKTNFRSAFLKHLHTHTNEMKYSCHVCNKKFRRADHMRAHEKRHIL